MAFFNDAITMHDLIEKEERAAQLVATACQNLLIHGAIDRTKIPYTHYGFVMGLRLDCFSTRNIEDVAIDTRLKKSLLPIPKNMLLYTLYTEKWISNIVYDVCIVAPYADGSKIKWGQYYHWLFDFSVTDQDAFNKDMSILKMLEDWECHMRIE